MRLALRAASAGHKMNWIAESYVKLALAVGAHDADFIDAYYGPPEWKAQADSDRLPLRAIEQRTSALIAELAG